MDPAEDRVPCSSCHRMVDPDEHDFEYCADPNGGDGDDD